MDEKTNTKQVIMEKAVMLFSAKGYEGVSVSQLTEAAGITKPTLYYYFGNKEGLLDALSQLYYGHLNQLIAENSVYHAQPESYFEDIYQTLTKLTSTYFTFAKNNENFYRMILANLSLPPSSLMFAVVKKYHFIQYELIECMFKEMSAVHKNLHGKSKMLTWSFLGAINSYVGLYFSGLTSQELCEDEINGLVRQFMHGIYV